MGDFIKVAHVDDIMIGQMKPFEVKRQQILICHTEEGFFALENACSHDSAFIHLGHIDKKHVVCPRHGARFDIKTGDVKAPPAVVGIERFEVKIENDEIYIKVD